MQKLFRDHRGDSAISYALLAGILSVGIIAGLTMVIGSEPDPVTGLPSGLLGAFYNVRATFCAIPAMACSP